jgi:hypothetical protein
VTAPVSLDLTKLHHLLGNSISTEAAEEILTRLGLNKQSDGTWQIPSFRQDLTRHIDLAEEITRVHGLANVPSRFRATLVPTSDVDAAYDADMILRRRLAALGLYECQTIKLISEAQLPDILPLRPLQEGDLIRVKSPLSEDHAIMRPSIVPGLVSSAERNARQQAKSIRLFEMGRVFRNAGGGKAVDQESDSLAILISGNADPASWSNKDRAADLYDAKAILSALLPNQTISLKPKDRENFALGAEIKAGDKTSVSLLDCFHHANALWISSPQFSLRNLIWQNSENSFLTNPRSKTSRNSPDPPAMQRWNFRSALRTPKSKPFWKNPTSRCSFPTNASTSSPIHPAKKSPQIANPSLTASTTAPQIAP